MLAFLSCLENERGHISEIHAAMVLALFSLIIRIPPQEGSTPWQEVNVIWQFYKEIFHVWGIVYQC